VEPQLLTQIESAFARITQAYDTLRDERLRANYDTKLQARVKAQQLASAAPKATAPAPSSPNKTNAPESSAAIAARAEQQFQEGYAALELGEKKVAVGLFAAAAKAMPNEARYRAFYGRMLAAHEHTQRVAEAEFQAAVKLDPGNAEYRAMLAELYRDLGLPLRARGEAERALAADPNNQKARDLLHTLKSV
jgi:tetratricopeptide (TPR) repeat protein